MKNTLFAVILFTSLTVFAGFGGARGGFSGGGRSFGGGSSFSSARSSSSSFGGSRSTSGAAIVRPSSSSTSSTTTHIYQSSPSSGFWSGYFWGSSMNRPVVVAGSGGYGVPVSTTGLDVLFMIIVISGVLLIFWVALRKTDQ